MLVALNGQSNARSSFQALLIKDSVSVDSGAYFWKKVDSWILLCTKACGHGDFGICSFCKWMIYLTANAIISKLSLQPGAVVNTVNEDSTASQRPEPNSIRSN